jgi:hypothetical protein
MMEHRQNSNFISVSQSHNFSLLEVRSSENADISILLCAIQFLKEQMHSTLENFLTKHIGTKKIENFMDDNKT